MLADDHTISAPTRVTKETKIPPILLDHLTGVYQTTMLFLDVALRNVVTCRALEGETGVRHGAGSLECRRP